LYFIQNLLFLGNAKFFAFILNKFKIPKGFKNFTPPDTWLSLDEIERIVRLFSELGVTKVRLTGGEPLVRKDLPELAHRLGALPRIRDLSLSTNASRLAEHADALKRAGVGRINISLDSLRPERFRGITRNGDLQKVLRGIDAARSAGFDRIKINSVILRGRNDDEVPDLALFALKRGMDISFIEEMPLGLIDGHDREATYCSSDEIRQSLSTCFDLRPSSLQTGGPSRYFDVRGYPGRIGFISPHSHNFCDRCNRVRLTATGRLLLCLGQEHSVELRPVLRAHPLDDEPVRQAIIAALKLKPAGHEFSLAGIPVIQRHMNATGG
jgi:cyclic pyranopterin phosphate synthase